MAALVVVIKCLRCTHMAEYVSRQQSDARYNMSRSTQPCVGVWQQSALKRVVLVHVVDMSIVQGKTDGRRNVRLHATVI